MLISGLIPAVITAYFLLGPFVTRTSRWPLHRFCALQTCTLFLSLKFELGGLQDSRRFEGSRLVAFEPGILGGFYLGWRVAPLSSQYAFL